MEVAAEVSVFRQGMWNWILPALEFQSTSQAAMEYEKFKCGTLNYKVQASEVKGCEGDR